MNCQVIFQKDLRLMTLQGFAQQSEVAPRLFQAKWDLVGRDGRKKSGARQVTTSAGPARYVF
jgi:hypothetical protein